MVAKNRNKIYCFCISWSYGNTNEHRGKEKGEGRAFGEGWSTKILNWSLEKQNLISVVNDLGQSRMRARQRGRERERERPSPPCLVHYVTTQVTD